MKRNTDNNLLDTPVWRLCRGTWPPPWWTWSLSPSAPRCQACTEWASAAQAASRYSGDCWAASCWTSRCRSSPWRWLASSCPPSSSAPPGSCCRPPARSPQCPRWPPWSERGKNCLKVELLNLMSRVFILPGNLWQEWHLLDIKQALTSLRVNLRFWFSFFRGKLQISLEIGPPLLSVQRMKGGQRLSRMERNGSKPIKLKCSLQQAWESWPLPDPWPDQGCSHIIWLLPLQRSTNPIENLWSSQNNVISAEKLPQFDGFKWRNFNSAFHLALSQLMVFVSGIPRPGIYMPELLLFCVNWEWMSSPTWGKLLATCLQINR